MFSVSCGEKTFQNGTFLALDLDQDTSAARACDVKVCSADPEVCWSVGSEGGGRAVVNYATAGGDVQEEEGRAAETAAFVV